MRERASAVRESILVSDYVRENFVPLSPIAHGWQFHSALPLTPAEERSIVREPAQAIPAAMAARLPQILLLAVPHLACTEAGDRVCFSKPQGETHSAVWVEAKDKIYLLLACRELSAHDTGFEFLASVAELLLPRLAEAERERYAQVLEDELRSGVRGEIDEEAVTAKQPLLGTRARRRWSRPQFERYRDVSFVSTTAEYLHGLWHDVQIRIGPEHLPLPQLRRRLLLLAELFPPNPGYRLFVEDLG